MAKYSLWRSGTETGAAAVAGLLRAAAGEVACGVDAGDAADDEVACGVDAGDAAADEVACGVDAGDAAADEVACGVDAGDAAADEVACGVDAGDAVADELACGVDADAAADEVACGAAEEASGDDGNWDQSKSNSARSSSSMRRSAKLSFSKSSHSISCLNCRSARHTVGHSSKQLQSSG